MTWAGGRATLLAGLWPLFDQAAVSLGAFLTTLILARELPAHRFGVFVLLYGLMLFLNTIHASLVVYPLSVWLPQAARGSAGQIAGGALVLAGLLVLPLSVIVFLVGWQLGGPLIGLLGAAALAAWQLQETTRRALMAELRHGAALPGDGLSFLGQAAGVALLAWAGALSLPAVLGLMTATSAVAAALQLALVRPARPSGAGLAAFAAAGWRAGRLVLVANALGALLIQTLPWVLAIREGAAGTAGFQALATLLGATNLVMLGLGNAVVPAVAHVRAKHGVEAARRRGLGYLLAGALLLAPYYLLLFLWPARILAAVYGSDSSYVALAGPLRLLTIGFLLLYLSHTGSTVLYGLELTGSAFVVQLAGTAALLTVGVPLTEFFGITGAALGTAAIHAARLAACARLGLRPAATVPLSVASDQPA